MMRIQAGGDFRKGQLGLVQTEQDAQSKKPELAYDGIVLELVLT